MQDPGNLLVTLNRHSCYDSVPGDFGENDPHFLHQCANTMACENRPHGLWNAVVLELLGKRIPVFGRYLLKGAVYLGICGVVVCEIFAHAN